MLQSNQKRIIEIFFEVARINALSQKEKPVADYLRSFLSSPLVKIAEDNSYTHTGSDTGNIICRIGDGGDTVLLSHMDTARPTLDTIPTLRNDKIVSDGKNVLGVDNRAGITALLYALELAILGKFKARDITVAFTTCEEITLGGSMNLDLNGKIKKGLVFDSSYRPGNFINSACGALGFTIKVSGKAAHSGLEPEKGINSIAAASKAIARIEQGKLDDNTTLNIGRISGGSQVNVVPEETMVEGEIRSFDAKKIEYLFKNVKETFFKEASNLGASVNVRKDWSFKPYTISDTEEVYRELSSVIKKVGLKPTPRKSLGGSDANSLNSRGIKTINLGIGAQKPHSNEEFIYVEDLVKASEIAIELIKQN